MAKRVSQPACVFQISSYYTPPSSTLTSFVEYRILFRMPRLTEARQGFVRRFRDSNSYIKYQDTPHRVTGWKKTLDEASAALVRGVGTKKEKKIDNDNHPVRVNPTD
jgi:hypothetical protein